MATSPIQLLDALARNRIRAFSNTNIGANYDTVEITCPSVANASLDGIIMSRYGIAAFTVSLNGSGAVAEVYSNRLVGTATAFPISYSGNVVKIKSMDWDFPIVLLGSPSPRENFYNAITVAFSHS